jgi:hypothetical protein
MKADLLPSTRLGKWSLWLLAAIFGFLVFFYLIIWIFQPVVAGGFFSAPILAIPLLLAFACGWASSITGIIAVILLREKSLLMIAPIVIGAFVVWFGMAEILGGGSV